MATVLLISLGILLAGIVGSVVLMVRSGEFRAGLLAACFSLIAVRQAIAVWNAGRQPLAFDASGISELALLAATAVGWFVLVGLWRSISERDRAESHHWESMEAVRTLSELAVRWDLSLDRKFNELLEVGCARFELEVGVISRVVRQRYEVLAILAPEAYPVTRGDVFQLTDTWCDQTLRGARPLGLERVAEGTPLPHAARAPFGFAAYLGASVRVFGEVAGTVAFGSRTPRSRRFTATDKDFAQLIAQWIGTELERHFAPEKRKQDSALRPTASKPKGIQPALSRGIDVNHSIRRAEKTLRSLVGDRVEIDFCLAENLHPAENLHIGAGAIVESLTRAALDALPAGGRISIATANLEIEQRGSNRAAQRHVTITLVATDADLVTDAFTRAFEKAGEARPTHERWNIRPQMTLFQLNHLLRRRGADLSLAVEPGVAATLTVYLPCASETKSAPVARTLPALRT